jgi:hypothetical protein
MPCYSASVDAAPPVSVTLSRRSPDFSFPEPERWLGSHQFVVPAVPEGSEVEQRLSKVMAMTLEKITVCSMLVDASTCTPTVGVRGNKLIQA